MLQALRDRMAVQGSGSRFLRGLECCAGASRSLARCQRGGSSRGSPCCQNPGPRPLGALRAFSAGDRASRGFTSRQPGRVRCESRLGSIRASWDFRCCQTGGGALRSWVLRGAENGKGSFKVSSLGFLPAELGGTSREAMSYTKPQTCQCRRSLFQSVVH